MCRRSARPTSCGHGRRDLDRHVVVDALAACGAIVRGRCARRPHPVHGRNAGWRRCRRHRGFAMAAYSAGRRGVGAPHLATGTMRGVDPDTRMPRPDLRNGLLRPGRARAAHRRSSMAGLAQASPATVPLPPRESRGILGRVRFFTDSVFSFYRFAAATQLTVQQGHVPRVAVGDRVPCLVALLKPDVRQCRSGFMRPLR